MKKKAGLAKRRLEGCMEQLEKVCALTSGGDGGKRLKGKPKGRHGLVVGFQWKDTKKKSQQNEKVKTAHVAKGDCAQV